VGEHPLLRLPVRIINQDEKGGEKENLEACKANGEVDDDFRVEGRMQGQVVHSTDCFKNAFPQVKQRGGLRQE